MGLIGAPSEFLVDWSAKGFGANKETGLLLIHGYTGSPASMQPWADYLNQSGYTVRVPLLPGHGTKPEDLNQVKWQEWPTKVERELAELFKTCRNVFICGLSMGGGTALYVASHNNPRISGIILVNPMIHLPFIGPKLAFFISRFQKFRKSVGDDIKRPGVTEYGYDALPTRGIYQLLVMLKYTRSHLREITVPMLLFHSANDHTLPVSNTKIVMKGVGSQIKERIELLNSFHVATIDNDAEIIFEKSRAFIETHSA